MHDLATSQAPASPPAATSRTSPYPSTATSLLKPPRPGPRRQATLSQAAPLRLTGLCLLSPVRPAMPHQHPAVATSQPLPCHNRTDATNPPLVWSYRCDHSPQADPRRRPGPTPRLPRLSTATCRVKTSHSRATTPATTSPAPGDKPHPHRSGHARTNATIRTRYDSFLFLATFRARSGLVLPLRPLTPVPALPATATSHATTPRPSPWRRAKLCRAALLPVRGDFPARFQLRRLFKPIPSRPTRPTVPMRYVATGRAVPCYAEATSHPHLYQHQSERQTMSLQLQHVATNLPRPALPLATWQPEYAPYTLRSHPPARPTGYIPCPVGHSLTMSACGR